MNKNEIQVKDIEKEEDAKTVLEYLQNLMKDIPG